MLSDTLGFFNNPLVSTPIIICVSTVLFVVLFSRPSTLSKKQTIEDAVREFSGSMLTILLCFTPGPFLGHLNGYEEWICHGLGLLVADYMSGSPHCNPAVSLAMVLFRVISVDEFFVKVSAQMIAGIIGFPLLQTLCAPYGVTIGGPEFSAGMTEGAMFDEAVGTFLLMVAVASFCMTWFGRFYYARMTLIAMTIRVICQVLNRAGPSLNPMLGTTWHFFKYGNWPQTTDHYLVYWASPMGGAAGAVLLFSILWSVTSAPPAEPPTLRQVWESYYRATTSKDSSTGTIMSFFAAEGKLLTCDDGKCQTLAQTEEEFGDYFLQLATSSKKGSTSPQVVVDDSARTVFVKWKVSKDQAGTDTIIFNENLKILRQHTTLFK
jgi:glycerol uptake facilitator-like aquaporin